jgi:two-component system, sensor histidine kinase
MGHSVMVASDGVEGLDAVRGSRPEIAIIDIGLPGLDGYALARAVRSDPALDGVRLVALTGYSGHENRQQAIEAGFQVHLVKPVDPKALRRVVETLGGS